MRRTSRVFVMASLFLAMTVPAWAQPDVFPPEPVDSEPFVLEGICAFDVEVTLSGKVGAIFFEDRGILTAPGQSADLTAVDGDGDPISDTISLKIPGVFLDTYLDDGDVRTMNSGRNLLFGEFFEVPGHTDGDPGLFLTVGKIVTEWNLEDSPTQHEVIWAESAGNVIDVCAMLAP